MFRIIFSNFNYNMNQNIFNNIIILIIIIILITIILPRPNNESTLYILQKYVNYIYDFIACLLVKCESFMGTINGIKSNNYNTPIFQTQYQRFFLDKYQKLYPNVDINKIKFLYYFVDSLVSLDTDNYFLSPDDGQAYYFSPNEKKSISEIILTKLNLNNKFIFSNFIFIKEPKYYNNFYGKDIEPFLFTVDINDPSIQNLTFYIQLAIRDDIKLNTSYLIFNTIRIIIDNNVVNSDNSVKNYTIPDQYYPNKQSNTYVAPYNKEIDFDDIIGPKPQDELDGYLDNLEINY